MEKTWFFQLPGQLFNSECTATYYGAVSNPVRQPYFHTPRKLNEGLKIDTL